VFKIFEHEDRLNTQNVRVEESSVLRACLDVLKDLTDAKPTWKPAPPDEGYDGEVKLRGAWGRATWGAVIKGFEFTPYRLESALPQLVSSARKRHASPMLMSTYLNPALAMRLREAGVNYVDAAGNAWLKQASLHVRVEGRRPEVPPERAPRPLQSAGLRLVTLFLEEPASVGWTYRAMADAAGVSLGSVNGVLDDLRGLGHLRVDRHGERHLDRVRTLFDRWEQGYLEVLRPKLLRKTCRLTGTRTLSDLAETVRSSGGSVRLGGELGAALLSKSLRPERASLHLCGEDVNAWMTRLRLASDPLGAVDLLDAVIPHRCGSPTEALASPWMIHAELVRALPDGRIEEAARELFDRHLAPWFGAEVSR
jgi:hypothetical protein